MLGEAVKQWVKERESIEECNCSADDPGDCWFRLTPSQMLSERLESFKKMLETDPL